MNYLKSLFEWFNDLSLQRKTSLLFTVAVIALITTCLSWWALTPTYGVLFTNLDEQDANQILGQLDQIHIDYQLRNGSHDILIEKNLIAKTRLKVMGSGMQLTNSVGFELFDKNDFGMTDFSQKINYQRALQGELERTITSFDEVRHARVHLVIPENHLFNKEDNQPKAAVTLHLKKVITQKQVQSIQQLITASVAHLSADQVVVVDQNGNTLSSRQEDSVSNHFSTKKAIEHYLSDKVTAILYSLFNKKQVLVKIDTELNYDELQRELIKPQSNGLVIHEKEIKHSTAEKTAKDKTNQDITSEKSYQLGSEKELYKRANGTIQKLSVSVVLPQGTDKQTLEQVRRLVKNAIGFNEKRGDLISVEALISAPHKTSIIKKSIKEPISISEHEKSLFYFAAILISALSIAAMTLIRRIRMKKRQLLLIELTQGLTYNE
ncbi:MAG: flagellar basal-body MS-ring/collar protein FliF [bacterium]|nr:flagellar basal-body MS-ring/collar protein FliF [bacterium]